MMDNAQPEVLTVTPFKCSLLVVDDEPYILATLAALLSTEYEVLTAESSDAAKKILEERCVDIVLSDQRMPRTSGVQLLEWIRERHPKTIRLLMTGFAELEEAVEAINRSQVFRYIFKPWRTEELMETLRSAAHTFKLERSHERLLEELRQLNLELDKKVQDRTLELEETNRELEQKNKMLEKLALTDPLTQLPNRRSMDRLAEREAAPPRPLSYAPWPLAWWTSITSSRSTAATCFQAATRCWSTWHACWEHRCATWT